MYTQDIGRLLLRLVVGGLLLFYGVGKIIDGIGYIEGLVTLQNLPKELAYGVYIGEVVAPILLILGWKSRFWAGVIVIDMGIAIYLVELKNIFVLGEHGALAIERPLMYLVVALAIVFLGGGKYSVDRG